MERALDVRTGESIGIRYELAGLGSRFLAVVLDFAIQLGVTAAGVVALLFAAGPLSAALRIAPVSATLGKTVQAVAGAAGVFALFIVYFGYYIAFELCWSGRTPGKRALGIRVVRDAGFPVDVGAAVIRNLIRVLEFGLGFYAVSAAAALLSPQNKRLGDMAAGTIVVRDEPYDADAIAALFARERPDDDGLGSADRKLVERYVARRRQLEPAARTRLAGQIAARIRPNLRASFAHLSDDELLEHLGRGATG